MENQHKLIKGSRDLSEDEITVINEIKAAGDMLAMLVNKLLEKQPISSAILPIDRRWMNIGQTHLQQGLMALTRAVTQPTGF